MIGEVSKRRIPLERIVRPHIQYSPMQKAGRYRGWMWRTLDQQLEEKFEYR